METLFPLKCIALGSDRFGVFKFECKIFDEFRGAREFVVSDDYERMAFICDKKHKMFNICIYDLHWGTDVYISSFQSDKFIVKEFFIDKFYTYQVIDGKLVMISEVSEINNAIRQYRSRHRHSFSTGSEIFLDTHGYKFVNPSGREIKRDEDKSHVLNILDYAVARQFFGQTMIMDNVHER